MIRRLLVLIPLTWLTAGPPGSPPVRAAGPRPEPSYTVLPLRPAVVPTPALRYRLTVPPSERVAGNAVLHLYRANLLLAEQRGQEQARTGHAVAEIRFDRKLADWLDLAPADLPRAEVRSLLDRFERVRREVRLAVRSDRADWQFAGRDEGIEFWMPEVQDARTLASLLALEAHLAIAEGHLDDACDAARAGFTLARIVADGPTLIQNIVGDSISLQMAGCLRRIVAAPGAPSLFWALADRPRPLIDMRPGFESERLLVEVEVPDLRELDHGAWTVERARRCGEAVQRLLISNGPGPGVDPATIRGELRRFDLALAAARAYPEARRALLAEGRPLAEVDARPVMQVALLGAYRRYVALRDETFRWANVPYPESIGRLDALGRLVNDPTTDPLLAGLLVIHSGGIGAAKWANTRAERQLDALQVVEAVRLDATRHDGRLPGSLDAIADLPLPLDPATGRAFEYRVEGTAAIVSGPAPAGYGDDLNHAVRLRLEPAPR